MFTCVGSTNTTPEAPENPSPEAWRQETVHETREIKLLCNRVAAGMSAAGYGGRDVFAVRLALEEAVVNAIRHGHRGDPAKAVRVRFSVDSDRILINVQDEGPGFDPYQIADPLSPENLDRSTGRGLLLMRHYMTWVKFNDHGNCVSLCKCRTF